MAHSGSTLCCCLALGGRFRLCHTIRLCTAIGNRRWKAVYLRYKSCLRPSIWFNLQRRNRASFGSVLVNVSQPLLADTNKILPCDSPLLQPAVSWHAGMLADVTWYRCIVKGGDCYHKTYCLLVYVYPISICMM